MQNFCRDFATSNGHAIKTTGVKKAVTPSAPG